MDNNILKYVAFLKTVEEDSFSGAAKTLNYAQSSISKMIADLEKEWGIVLLERGKSGLHLTTAGEQILPHIKTVVNTFENLENYVNEFNGLQRGIVRIGSFSSVAINWIPNIFAEFQRDYPGIDYELLLGDYDEIQNWIKLGRIDCGFIGVTDKTNMNYISLKKDEYKVVLSKNHPLAKHKAIDIKQLDNQPFFLLEHGGKTEVTRLLEKHNVMPQIRLTTWEDFAIMAMVEQGLGISILPELILKRIPYDLAIRPLKTPFYREIGLAFKNKNNITPATAKFVEYLKYREDMNPT